MDKAGHLFNGYWITTAGIGLYRWTGMKDRNAIWMGGIVGNTILSGVELLDGFSAKWGASWSDMAANIGGSALAMAQEFAWQEQRIQLKFSAHPINYAPDVSERANELYGNTFAETILKDYNALTIWASVTPADYMKEDTWFPKWLNISLGYGADGLYGGFENRWCDDPLVLPEDCPMNDLHDRTDILRMRQYYLSLDVNWSRIKTNSSLMKVLLNLLNLVKVPAPALMMDSNGDLRFYPVYF